MLSKALQQAINDQVRTEFQSAYTYLAMAAHFEAANLPGFARWMRLQHEEEWAHGMKLFDFLLDRGGDARLQGLEPPKVAGKTALDVFQLALQNERTTTALIGKLYEVAGKERDYATQTQLQWFLNEQVEEERSVTLIVERLKMAGDTPAALLMLDRELGARGPEGKD